MRLLSAKVSVNRDGLYENEEGEVFRDAEVRKGNGQKEGGRGGCRLAGRLINLSGTVIPFMLDSRRHFSCQ